MPAAIPRPALKVISEDESTRRLDGLRRDLVRRVMTHARSDGEHRTAIPELTIWRAAVGHRPGHIIHRPALAIVLQGAKRVRLADEVYDYDATHHLLVSHSIPVVGEVTQASPDEPYLSLRLEFDPAQLLRDTPAVLPPTAKGPSSIRGLVVGRNTVELLEPVLRLVRLLDTAEHLQVLAPLAMRELFYRLVVADHGGRIAHALALGPGQRIGRAIDWLHDHFMEAFSVDTLAEVVNMSPSSLRQHFRAITAMSPLQYRNQLRLQAARQLLLSGSTDAASAAFSVGYGSVSQFSREYSRLFGMPPARDLRRWRGQQDGAVSPKLM